MGGARTTLEVRPQTVVLGNSPRLLYICARVRVHAHMQSTLPFEHCVLRELMRTSLLIHDGLRKENAANLHRQAATH